MSKNRQHILWSALLLASTLALWGCGFAAKNLAKQVSDLTKKAADIEKQAAELQEKAADIEEKAAALSPKDRRAYQEELARLGFEPPDWLFGDAEALASGAPEETEDEAGGILGGIARLIGGLLGGRSGGRTANSASGATEAEIQAAPTSSTAPTTTTSSGGTAASSGGGTFTLTGIPSQYNGKYAMVGARTISRPLSAHRALRRKASRWSRFEAGGLS